MSTTARAIMRTIPLFKNFSDEACDALDAVLHTRQIQAGSVVFHQGELGTTMVIVLEGHLRVEMTDQAGHHVEIGHIESGEVVGEMAVVDPGERSATVLAVSDALVYELSRDGLQQLRKSCAPAAAAIVSAIIGDVTRRLRNINERIDQELRVDAPKQLPPRPHRPSSGLPPVRTHGHSPSAAVAPVVHEPSQSVFSRLWARLTGD